MTKLSYSFSSFFKLTSHSRAFVLALLISAPFVLGVYGCSEDSPTSPPGNNDTIDTTDTITHDSVGSTIEMVSIEPGSFEMGFTTYIPDPDEYLVQNVTITRPYLIGAYELTQQEYFEVMGGAVPADSNKRVPHRFQSLESIVLYCNELSKKEGLDTAYVLDGEFYRLEYNSVGYRMPTEAEWEYACRAGTNMDTYTYLFSDVTKWEDRIARTSEIAWISKHPLMEGKELVPQVVGQLQPNAWGLYDILGNSAEVVGDKYILPNSRKPIDPYYDGPIYDGIELCIKSSAIILDHRYARCSLRDPVDDNLCERITVVGLRVARTSQ